jgi:anti-sigma B factor antagonist
MIEVTQETHSDWRVLRVKGRADSAAADDFEADLRQAVADHARVAVDLSELTYVSSAGLRAIIQAARAAQGSRSELVFCALSAPVKKVFDMSGMEYIVKTQEKLPC